MRVRLSDATSLPAFVTHLVLQGFPARASGADVVEILFPAHVSHLERAAELDLWRSTNGDVTIVPLPDWERS